MWLRDIGHGDLLEAEIFFTKVRILVLSIPEFFLEEKDYEFKSGTYWEGCIKFDCLESLTNKGTTTTHIRRATLSVGDFRWKVIKKKSS